MSRSKKKRHRKGTGFVQNCQYLQVGGHYDCELEEIAYKTVTGHSLCFQHALMWTGQFPLHSEDDGLIREIQNGESPKEADPLVG